MSEILMVHGCEKLNFVHFVNKFLSSIDLS